MGVVTCRNWEEEPVCPNTNLTGWCSIKQVLTLLTLPCMWEVTEGRRDGGTDISSPSNSSRARETSSSLISHSA